MALTQRPVLLLVNGLPATGKTTLARTVAAELGWPVLHKDDVKEILFDTLGYSTRAESRRLGVATSALLFHMIDAQLAAGVDCVLENNFKPDAAREQINAICALRQARALQIFCECAPELRVQRFLGRARHPGHADDEITQEIAGAMRAETLEPVALDAPLLRVDTTSASASQQDEVLSWVKHHIHR